MQPVQSDFSFAAESGEFSRQAPLLRYVAAINPQLTQAQFVAEAMTAGYVEATARIQFRQSRRVSVETDPHLYLLSDGRLVEGPSNV